MTIESAEVVQLQALSTEGPACVGLWAAVAGDSHCLGARDAAEGAHQPGALIVELEGAVHAAKDENSDVFDRCGGCVDSRGRTPAADLLPGALAKVQSVRRGHRQVALVLAPEEEQAVAADGPAVVRPGHRGAGGGQPLPASLGRHEPGVCQGAPMPEPAVQHGTLAPPGREDVGGAAARVTAPDRPEASAATGRLAAWSGRRGAGAAKVVEERVVAPVAAEDEHALGAAGTQGHRGGRVVAAGGGGVGGAEPVPDGASADDPCEVRGPEGVARRRAAPPVSHEEAGP
eukprot:CAMPEP_0175416276 /NCGR_PEP_ID=MMETSP0095-20121207/44607_1 /TAXON_ID=311494 /ORGANISM="Alexandrium monilatum, Strain CCMP3105" /LENGTH=287 /DNA_ID=CAMNT_0016715385 /DNA_START=33 /DNA_END=893 /DNA_ORIENTATION=-